MKKRKEYYPPHSSNLEVLKKVKKGNENSSEYCAVKRTVQYTGDTNLHIEGLLKHKISIRYTH